MSGAEIITPGALTIIARPHPLSMKTVHAEFALGSTIREIVGLDAVACRVEMGGMTIPEEMWGHVRPRSHVAVVITRFPQGGAGKAIFRIIAFAALAVAVVATAGGALAFTPALGALFGSSATLFAAGSISAGLLAAGIGLVGSLIINALCPPSASAVSSSQSTDTLNSITGTSNQINRFGVIPCALGTIKVFPPYAALPVTEYSGDDQYLRCLFDCGWGDPDVSEMKIGDTELSSYTDVQTEVGTNPSLFPSDILEESVGVEMDADASTTTRTTGVGAAEISLDLVWASGLFGVDSKGNTTTATCAVRVEYAVAGSGSWQRVVSGTLSHPGAVFYGDGTIHVTNGVRKAVRLGVYWNPPSVDQYDVRVTRVSTDYGGATGDNQLGNMQWTVIRTIRNEPVSTTGTKKIALRIKASDQLSGSISQFNCILSQNVPVWDGTTWVTQHSSNPAWLYRWMCKDSPANPRAVPAERIDDEALIEWAAECDARGLTYNGNLDQPTTMLALLKDFCAAGRAAWGMRDGRYTVVRDILQTVPVQVFTPRNSWGFAGTRAFPDAVHALRCSFINPEANWQADERIVYDDGYGDEGMVAADPTLTLATNFEQLTLPGCTDAECAFRLGRYHLANGRLRPNNYSLNADIEHMVCSRGDLVLVASDVICAGLAWGKVRAITADEAGNVTAIRLDEEVTLAAGTSYGVHIRKPNRALDGTPLPGSMSVAVVGVTATPNQPTKYLTLNTAQANVQEDDLVIVGEIGSSALPMIVTKIEPSTDMSAKITAVDAAPAVQVADTGPVPAWNSQITGQPWQEPPAAPDLIVVSSHQSLSQLDDSGVTAPTMLVTVSGSWSGVSRGDQLAA